MTPKFEVGRDFCTLRLLHVSSSYIYSFGSHRVDKQTNKQTPLKTPNALRYAISRLWWWRTKFRRLRCIQQGVPEGVLKTRDSERCTSDTCFSECCCSWCYLFYSCMHQNASREFQFRKISRGWYRTPVWWGDPFLDCIKRLLLTKPSCGSV